MKYKHFTAEERELVQLGLWQKKSVRTIATELTRSPSSVSREIKRNKPPEFNRYTPRLAHERAITNRSKRGRTDRLKNDTIREYTVTQLKNGYSPEQIAGRLPFDHRGEHISHEAIYQYIYAQFYRGGNGRCIGEDLRIYLKRRHKRRTAKGMRKGQRIFRSHGTSIELRPVHIEKRKQLGHWEGDSVVSRQSLAALNTLVERKTGLVFITKIKDHTAQVTLEAVVSRLGILPYKQRRTLTVDNGTENANYKEITDAINTQCFFAHPYSSWERGTNENTNGLIRWYLPKKTDFATISDEEVSAIETALNNRPRKRLGWRTPLEVFNVSVALTG